MKKIIVLAIVIILVVLAAFKLKASRDKNVNQVDKFATNEVTVNIADVTRKSQAFVLNLTGTLCPSTELDIPAETAGKLTSLNFTLGKSVGKGAVIANIDDKLKNITLQSAKIDAEKLKKDLERTENLYKGGTATEQEYDHAKTSYETAKNKVEEDQRQLSYTKITAPISGTITKKIVEAGTYVNPGTAIATIVDVAKLKVKINVSESNVYYLHVGDRVKITTDIYQGVTFTGKISFVTPRGDDSHNYPVEIEVANSGKNILKGGTFVNVEVNIGSSKEGLYIPRTALQGSIKDAKVYVASSDGKAVLRNILIGRESNESLEVLSGLSEGDKVVVSGQVNLTDGKAIKISNNK
jgi:RND family efflux transporter MFP subunit